MPDLYLSGTTPADGLLTLRVTPRGSYRWIVRQVSPSMSSPTAVTGLSGYVAKNGLLIAPFVPGADAVAGEPPVELQPGDEMTINWENATPGDVGRAWVQYEELS